jgi:hypothetical protein
VPDAPINLQNDPSTTSDTVIRLTWTQGLSDGSTPVLDYDIYYDQSTATWVLLEETVLDTSYKTSISLTSGATYAFKVTARNSVGDSLQSE